MGEKKVYFRLRRRGRGAIKYNLHWQSLHAMLMVVKINHKETYMELVELKRKEIFCDSHIIARKFGLKNAYVNDNIRKVISDLDDFRVGGSDPKCVTEEREYRGQKYTAYLMNRDFFSFLVMRFKGKKAIRWQLEFIAAFNAMENSLLLASQNSKDEGWLAQRTQSKQARIQETDVIKEFVDYATEQGSKSAKFYYKHITRATYKALGFAEQKNPKLRDTLDLYQIAELTLAERRVKLRIRKCMDLKRNYKDIYVNIKEELEAFGDSLKMV